MDVLKKNILLKNLNESIKDDSLSDIQKKRVIKMTKALIEMDKCIEYFEKRCKDIMYL